MTAEPQLTVRTDASAKIGTGHVMRCLAIAQAWQDVGGQVTFLSAGMPDVLRERLLSSDIRIENIAATSGSSEDAKELVRIASRQRASAIVIDGYQFNEQYLDTATSGDAVILTIDDDGRLKHYGTDFVLNQNLGADHHAYTARANSTELLLGTKYALVRREFLQTIEQERCVSESTAERILVTLGGSDPENVTAMVVDGLKLAPHADLEVHVIVGGLSQHFDELAQQVHCDKRFTLLRNVEDMVAQYEWADLAIAAGGSSNWEMCYFGLPRVVLVIADNQKMIAEQLHQAEVAINLGEAEFISPDLICQAVESLFADHARMNAMRLKSRALVDGLGAARCVSHLLNQRCKDGEIVTENFEDELIVREATFEDEQLLLNWRNDAETRSASRNSAPVDEREHGDWLRSVLANANVQLLIAELGSKPVGTVRLDFGPVCEVSWTVSPAARGMGIGQRMVSQAVRNVAFPMRAVARVSNVASHKIAYAAGFRLLETDEDWMIFQRDPSSVGSPNE